jgi:RHS repeat-associated protein
LIETSVPWRYYIADLLGSVRAVVDETGDVKENRDYDPWGVPMDQRQYVAGDKALEQFSGQELDDETGWYHFGQRDLMAIYGRWPSPDRFADKYPSHSPYSYALNDPIGFVDVNGDTLDIQGSRDFTQEVYDAIIYLEKAGVAGVLEYLHNSPETITITEGSGLNDFYYNPDTNTIVFNPFSALETVDNKGNPTGELQTPALGLLHEGGHAKNDIDGTTDLTPRFDGYTNNEEYNVIQYVENPAAIILSEPTRSNHGGIPFRTTCSTCINRAPTPKPPSLIEKFKNFILGGN